MTKIPEKQYDYDHNGSSFVEHLTAWEKGYNKCHEDFSNAMIEMLEKIKLPDVESECGHNEGINYELDQLIKELKWKEWGG